MCAGVEAAGKADVRVGDVVAVKSQKPMHMWPHMQKLKSPLSLRYKDTKIGAMKLKLGNSQVPFALIRISHIAYRISHITTRIP